MKHIYDHSYINSSKSQKPDKIDPNIPSQSSPSDVYSSFIDFDVSSKPDSTFPNTPSPSWASPLPAFLVPSAKSPKLDPIDPNNPTSSSSSSSSSTNTLPSVNLARWLQCHLSA